MVLEVFQQFAKVQEKNVILEAPKGNLYSYLWSNGATSRTISVSPTKATVYNVQIQIPGTSCGVEFQQEVKVSKPIVAINDISKCEGGKTDIVLDVAPLLHK